MLWTLAKTGLRHGELLGLRECDIVGGQVRTRQQFKETYDNKGNPKFVGLKSLTRDITIPSDLFMALDQWKLKNPESEYGLLFCKADGNPFRRKDTRKIFLDAIDTANASLPENEKLKKLTIHSIRHSFASILLNPPKSKPPITVQYLLGHTSLSTTLRVYTHFIKPAQDYKPEADPVIDSHVPQMFNEIEARVPNTCNK